MKFRGLALSLVLASNTFLLVGAACGGSDDGGPGADSGAEGASTDGPTGSTEAGCGVALDLLAAIPEDASIADGATTSGACLVCLKNACGSALSACANDCACKTAAAKVLSCVEQNQKSPELCSSSFLNGGAIGNQTQTFGIALLLCVDQKCKDDCAVAAFEQDSGPKDSSTDARESDGDQ